jgi:hypothetical protein
MPAPAAQQEQTRTLVEYIICPHLHLSRSKLKHELILVGITADAPTLEATLL